MRRFQRLFGLLGTLVAVLAFVASTSGPAHAQFGGTTGDWINTGVPATGYEAGITNGGVGGATQTSGTASLTAAYPIQLGYASGGTGTLVVSGSGTLVKWASGSANNIFVGTAGSGTLNLTTGSITNTGTSYIGYNSGAAGTAYVDSSPAKWTTTTLYVGSSGTGTLNITNGGFVADTTGYIGYSGGSGTANVGGSTAKWTNTTLYVGGGATTLGAGALYIASSGSVSATNANVGNGNGSAGAVTVDASGGASRWTVSAALTLGNNGSGTLQIQNGGYVSAATTTVVPVASTTGVGSISFGPGGGTLSAGTYIGLTTALTGTGTMNATGLVSNIDLLFDSTHGTTQPLSFNGGNITGTLTASGQLGVGNGTLQIKDALSVTSSSAHEGYFAGTSGTATVSGGSTWTSGTAHYVGNYGNGKLNVLSGSTVTATDFYVGEKPAATGLLTVDGPGSTLSAPSKSHGFAIGDYGAGTMVISNGATVTGYQNYVGNQAASQGTVTVDGSGSDWVCTKVLLVGNLGIGSLNIQNQGMVQIDGGVQGSGIVNFDGGILKAYSSGNLSHGTGDQGWIASTFAQVNIKEGGATLDDSGYFGTINAPLLHAGDATIDGGLTKIGGGTTTVSVPCYYTGPTTVKAGILSLANAYLADANYVRIDSGAVLDLAHSATDTVRFLFLGGVPQPAGVYSNGTSPTYITSGGSLNVAYSVLPGDADANGAVNGADLNTVLSNYNQSGDWFHGDFSGNATVNGEDLNIVLSNYNQSISAAAAVPEPSALALAAGGLAALMASIWRRRK